MARIAGVNIDDKLKIDYALTTIKGIGWTLSKKILEDAKVGDNKRVSELSTEELSKIASEVEKHPTEGELARRVRANVTRLKQITSYKGVRHGRGLPVRGQRTRTNARTKRGKRKTVGAFKKEDLAKQTSTSKE